MFHFINPETDGHLFTLFIEVYTMNSNATHFHIRPTVALVEQALIKDESGAIARTVQLIRRHAHSLDHIGAHHAAHVLKKWSE